MWYDLNNLSEEAIATTPLKILVSIVETLSQEERQSLPKYVGTRIANGMHLERIDEMFRKAMRSVLAG